MLSSKSRNANTSLINGLGRYPGGPPSPLAVVSVTQGLRYRFRIVQMSCGAAYTFSIDNHRLTIIETDGVEIVPYVVDSIAIFAGEVYSLFFPKLRRSLLVGNFFHYSPKILGCSELLLHQPSVCCWCLDLT